MANEYQDFNVPDGVRDNMTAGQSVVFAEGISDIAAPGSIPTTQVGYIKEFKILVEGIVLEFEQGMPQVVVNAIKTKTNVTMSWEGFEWNLDLFQLLVGNEDVNEAIGGSKFWGIGGEATMTNSKFAIFHKMLDGRFIWIYVWGAAGDGNFNLEFPDDTWLKVPFVWKLKKGTLDFDDATLTKDYYFRIEETNLPCP